jgi:transposase
LVNRIQRHGTEWFTFLDYPEVKPDNHDALRAWRRVVVHRRVSGGALRDWGALAVAQMLSFWETVGLQGQSAIAQLYQLLCSCWSQSSGFTVLLNYLLVSGW